jgi:hypothetical protein
MKIKIDEAQRIAEKYGTDEVPILFLSDAYVNTHAGVVQISAGMRYDPSQYDLFIDGNVREVEVVFSERLYAKLCVNFPETWRLPVGRLDFINMDRFVEEIDNANSQNKRKRNIISLTEVYKRNPSGHYETILKYGEKLDIKSWNQVKVNLNRNASIDYRLDECGIIIYVILNPSDPNYAQKYMTFTSLITLLVEQKHLQDVTIAPDFYPQTDVFPVTDKESLLKTYGQNNVALVIVGDELSDDYKMSLAQLKMYDKYARMMVIRNPDPTQSKSILNMIRNLYGKKLWL